MNPLSNLVELPRKQPPKESLLCIHEPVASACKRAKQDPTHRPRCVYTFVRSMYLSIYIAKAEETGLWRMMFLVMLCPRHDNLSSYTEQTRGERAIRHGRRQQHLLVSSSSSSSRSSHFTMRFCFAQYDSTVMRRIPSFAASNQLREPHKTIDSRIPLRNTIPASSSPVQRECEEKVLK